MNVPRTVGKIVWVPPSLAFRFLLEGLIFVPPGAVELPRRMSGGGVLLAMVGIQLSDTSRTGVVIFLDPDTGRHVVFPLPGRPGFIFRVRSGRKKGLFLVGIETSICLVQFDLIDGTSTIISVDEIPDPRPGEIINDSIVSPASREGRAFAIIGTKCFTEGFFPGGAGLYHWEPGQVRPLLRKESCSNGKYWRVNADGQLILGDIDSPTGYSTEAVFDPATATLGRRRILIDLRADKNFRVLDGQVLTPDGKSVIPALFNYGAVTKTDGEVHRYGRESRRLEQVWVFPESPQMTTVCLARKPGRKRCTLYALSAIEHMKPAAFAANPNSGVVWEAETDIEGEPREDVLVLKSVETRSAHAFARKGRSSRRPQRRA
ncbi:MAG: SMP-30/gluconolactonase/LRE family protein [Verrucomicrobia bacterium]|nr:SMP-30/gluconolactonase/LRE family protein [Verrucomicrobiota bacterium]